MAKAADLLGAAHLELVDGVVHLDLKPEVLEAMPAGRAAADSVPERGGHDHAAVLADRRHDPVKIEVADDPTNPDNDRIASNGLLPSPHATLAGPTFEEWLARTS